VVLLFGAEALVDAMLWPAGGAKGWMPGCVGMGRGTFQVVCPSSHQRGGVPRLTTFRNRPTAVLTSSGMKSLLKVQNRASSG